MKKEIKPATQEEVIEKNKTTQKTKIEIEKEDREELKTKRKQLKDDESFLNGGDVRIGAMVNHIAPIDEAIRRKKRHIEKLQIMRENLVPIQAKFKFETVPRYKEIGREELKEEQDEERRKLQQMNDLKEETIKRVPETKKRINELEKKLGEKITDFKSEKVDYIG